jgi:hypothetical protein
VKAAEFEEKEYEHPLLNQLERGNPQFWSPGQVLEFYLGFDRGLFLTAEYLWQLHGVRTPLRGVVPYNEFWPYLPGLGSRRDRLPSFRLNCFVQAKRCEVGTRLPKRLAGLGSSRPFYRFVVDSTQQQALSTAATALANRALFTYAAPVFFESRRLFFLQQIGQLVENSTFPDVRTLVGHHAWYYNSPGSTGVVNQDFERVESPSLLERIALLRRESGVDERERTASDNLVDLAAALRRAASDVGETVASARGAYLADDWRDIDRFAEQNELPQASRAFLEVDAFTRRFGVEWLVIADGAA